MAKASGGEVRLISGDALVLETKTIKRNERASLMPATWDGVAIFASFEKSQLPTVKIADHLPAQEPSPKNNSMPFELRFDE